jgi:hypothetical protein
MGSGDLVGDDQYRHNKRFYRNYGMDVLKSFGSHVRLVHVNNAFRLAGQYLPSYE